MQEWSRGQAMVEAAIILPLVIFLIAAIVQVGLIFHARILLQMAVRQGLRMQAARMPGTASQVQKFLEDNLPAKGVEFQVDAKRVGTFDQVVVKCKLPVFSCFRGVLGDFVHLRAELKADAYGVPLLSILFSYF